MSPTVFRHRNFRFFFFSREESRPHVHITCPEGQAKFWLEPIVSLAHFHGIQARVLKHLQLIVEERHNEILRAWKKHFVR
jgi:hypothetical protein